MSNIVKIFEDFDPSDDNKSFMKLKKVMAKLNFDGEYVTIDDELDERVDIDLTDDLVTQSKAAKAGRKQRLLELKMLKSINKKFDEFFASKKYSVHKNFCVDPTGTVLIKRQIWKHYDYIEFTITGQKTGLEKTINYHYDYNGNFAQFFRIDMNPLVMKVASNQLRKSGK